MERHNDPKVVQLLNLTSRFDLLASTISSSLLHEVLQNIDCNPSAHPCDRLLWFRTLNRLQLENLWMQTPYWLKILSWEIWPEVKPEVKPEVEVPWFITRSIWFFWDFFFFPFRFFSRLARIDSVLHWNGSFSKTVWHPLDWFSKCWRVIWWRL